MTLTRDDCIQRVRDLTAGIACNHFQQDHTEFGSFVNYLLRQPEQPKSYFEIGAGSGHVARVFDTFFDFDVVRLIDIRQYPERLVNMPKAVEWVGDSTGEDAIKAVDGWGLQFDFIYVDGDHAYESAVADTYLALRCVHPGTFVGFHDARHAEVRRWLDEVKKGAVPGLVHLHTFGRYEPQRKLYLENMALFQWSPE